MARLGGVQGTQEKSGAFVGGMKTGAEKFVLEGLN
jgi:hypothetical protein